MICIQCIQYKDIGLLLISVLKSYTLVWISIVFTAIPQYDYITFLTCVCLTDNDMNDVNYLQSCAVQSLPISFSICVTCKLKHNITNFLFCIFINKNKPLVLVGYKFVLKMSISTFLVKLLPWFPKEKEKALSINRRNSIKYLPLSSISH